MTGHCPRRSVVLSSVVGPACLHSHTMDSPWCWTADVRPPSSNVVYPVPVEGMPQSSCWKCEGLRRLGTPRYWTRWG